MSLDKPKSRRIEVPPYESNPADLALKQALLDWRARTAEGRWSGIEIFGHDVLMHYDFLQRIVDLAHWQHLTSLDAFEFQVGWCLADQYGAELMDIVSTHCPQQPPSPKSPSRLASDAHSATADAQR
ncbi:hypothetical protein BC834DRAFT_575723 [Gloeopeniophorella convolvens]|nr:hypothetical protein BC834DRAFT_575723 [Gloeopeniophorella convolvens]